MQFLIDATLLLKAMVVAGVITMACQRSSLARQLGRPGSREPSPLCWSRPFGFDPSRKSVWCPSPGAVGPVPRLWRRCADTPAATLLTGLGAAVGPASRPSVGAMLTLLRPRCFVWRAVARLEPCFPAYIDVRACSNSLSPSGPLHSASR
mgnify:CR=1 FL=1